MIEPMLCQTGTAKDLDREGFACETKYDGTRALIIKTNRGFSIQNRNGIDYTKRLPEITRTAKDIKDNYVIDGEVCFFNEAGNTVFTPCQRRCSTQNMTSILALARQFPVRFMAFDILEFNGKDVRNRTYLERKTLLRHCISGSKLAFAEHSLRMKEAFEHIIRIGGEGLILKKLDSTYQDGLRSFNWLKIKRLQQTTCEIVGFTEGESWRQQYFGSLVLTQNGKYVGKVGSGFNMTELEQLSQIMNKCQRIPKPFDIDEPYTAIKTDLKARIRYFERSENGIFRFPIFLFLCVNRVSYTSKAF